MVHLAGLVRLEEGTGGPFDLINGLPVHPLVVHSAVVLVPLTALGVLLMAVWPRFSRSLGWLVALSGLVAAGSAFVAKESGEALEGRVGEPAYDHAELGDVMPILAAVLLVAAVALWLIDRSAPAEGPAPRRGLRIAVAALAALVAVGNLVWIYRVGDSGAKSVWSGEVSGSSGASGEAGEGDEDGSAEGAATPTASASTGATAAAGTYTLAQVATHDSPSDCWAAINGDVYDLTAWIDQHPGGAQRIIDICGTDGSAAFDDQHSGQSEPEQDLAQFQVGALQ
jgi:uncharacterized membrane protein